MFPKLEITIYNKLSMEKNNGNKLYIPSSIIL